jgi:hypothetical protein
MNIKVFCVFQYGGLLSDLLEWNSVDFCHGLSLCRGCCLVFIFKAVAKQTVTCGSGIIGISKLQVTTPTRSWVSKFCNFNSIRDIHGCILMGSHR